MVVNFNRWILLFEFNPLIIPVNKLERSGEHDTLIIANSKDIFIDYSHHPIYLRGSRFTVSSDDLLGLKPFPRSQICAYYISQMHHPNYHVIRYIPFTSRFPRLAR